LLELFLYTDTQLIQDLVALPIARPTWLTSGDQDVAQPAHLGMVMGHGPNASFRFQLGHFISSKLKIFNIFLIIFQNYTIVSKFISFDNQSHDDCRYPQRFEVQPPWATAVGQTPWLTTVVDGGCRNPTMTGSRLVNAVRHGGCMWPTAVGHCSCFF
jgi:hypothetical protein